MMLVTSCNKLTENHYHDGVYEGEIWDIGGEWIINGNEIIVKNDLSGTTKIMCKQFEDRIEYTMPDGTIKILTVLENGNLKFSDILILEKVQPEEEEFLLNEKENEKKVEREIHQVKKKLKNQTQNFDLSKDSYQNGYALIEDIKIVENEVYIVVDIVQIEYPQSEDEDDYSLSYEIINQNPKLRTYKAVPKIKIRTIDNCMGSTTLNYLIDNKDRIKTISPFGFVLITTNKNGELTELNLG